MCEHSLHFYAYNTELFKKRKIQQFLLLFSSRLKVREPDESAIDSHSHISTSATAQTEVDLTANHIRCSGLIPFFRCLKNFHWKKTGCKKDKVLILFRVFSIIGLFVSGVIDTIIISSNSNYKTNALQFIHGSSYIPIEICTIVYASGAGAFGTGVEMYILLLQAVANVILLAVNCRGSDEFTNGIIWIVKLILLFVSVELCYRNFHKLRMHREHLNSSTRSMLRQALIVGATMLVENLTGIRAVYRAANMHIPHHCTYEMQHCGYINLYEPLFQFSDDECLNDLSLYVAGREQIKLLRDFILLNIVSYSIFNKNFLKIRINAKYRIVRTVLVLLLLALGTSSLVSYVDTLFFIRICRLAYTLIEVTIFVIIFGLIALNLYLLRGKQKNLSIDIGEMDKSPSLIP